MYFSWSLEQVFTPKTTPRKWKRKGYRLYSQEVTLKRKVWDTLDPTTNIGTTKALSMQVHCQHKAFTSLRKR